jgi:methyl-accepting chemotaxis protein
MKFLKKLSLSSKLIIGFLLTGLIPAVIVSYVSFQNNGKAIRAEAKNKLIAIKEAKAFQLEELFVTMRSQVSALANNQLTVDAMENFEKSFESYQSEQTKDLASSQSALSAFYKDQFGKKYGDENLNRTFDKFSETYGKLNSNEVLLQDAFISSNSNKLGEKDSLLSLKNGTSYSKNHELYHETFRTYLYKFGFYDIFLVSEKTGEVVYSVFKELDFATNLKNGPYANSGLADAYKASSKLKKAESTVTEMRKYYPSYDAPAQFVASPIYKDGSIIGHLVFQIPVAKINDILTGKQSWKKQGQGDSGETYIISSDKSMRSISRFIVDDEAGFFDLMAKIKVPKDKIDYMRSKKTTAITAVVNTRGADEVIKGKSGTDIFPDYRNVNVLSAYRPLKIDGLKWYILSEMDEDEALASLYALKKIVILLISLSVIAILISSYFLAKGLSNSIIKMTSELGLSVEKFLSMAGGISTQSGQLSEATTQQAASLQESSSSINEISAMVERSSTTASETMDLSSLTQQKAQAGKQSVSQVKVSIEDIHENNEQMLISIEKNNEDVTSIIQVINEIAEKTKVINDIVFQTKLLSFNASVEAARAGEHGKGFSVVAEEVGALAQMSGKAAGEISELLESSTKQVEAIVENSKGKLTAITESGKDKVAQGISRSDECDKILDEILQSFEEVNNAVRDIATSSQEQSAGVSEITNAIQELDGVTQQNSSVAAETARKAEELRIETDHLASLTQQMRELVFGANSDSPSEVEIKSSSSRKLDDDFEDVA